MTRRYEVVYIFDAALDEAAVTERLAKFHALLGADVQPAVNHWGKRSLAYPIKRRETGYYVITSFDAAPTVLPEFERAIKLDESVIRHLVVIQGPEPTKPVVVEAGVAAAAADEDDES